MKVKDQLAIRKEGARIFENLKRLRFNPSKRWHRIKAKILGAGWRNRAMCHDDKILKEMGMEFHELNEAIRRGHYHIEITMDEAGFSPLPCPLCHGEKKIFEETVMNWGWNILLWRWIDIYEECPVCRGSGYMPALTKLQKKLLKESVPLHIPCP